MFLFPLFYVIREFHRFLHRGKANSPSPLLTSLRDHVRDCASKLAFNVRLFLPREDVCRVKSFYLPLQRFRREKSLGFVIFVYFPGTELPEVTLVVRLIGS